MKELTIDFEKELYKAFGQVKDFTLGMRIAKWFYDMGKNSQEPVSEDLEEAAEVFIDSLIPTEVDTVTPFAAEYVIGLLNKAIEFGANWQKEQMMKNVKWCTIVKRDTGISLQVTDKEIIRGIKNCEHVNVIILKEE